ncbi:hypothetical protein NLX83_17985 [Allokutzneria sp. A3M-2-11 16]|uniref:hypothetical protein n=1 Tax=Allokutzneria sp. A3M-2-11 16 TaxID=2962043 RepID=UPI0020B779A1|nr:hypothetical protein [Allokutzneria sp. A3M-2-11 16]MCP3801154.1 hypothetical protein [Allokutzneria sp. A3M-2-11 16]
MSTDPRLSTLRRYAIAVGASVEHLVRDTVRSVNVPVTVEQVPSGKARVRKLPIKEWPVRGHHGALLGAQGD